MNQSWTIKSDYGSTMVGIMDEETIQNSDQDINDFTSPYNGGYGMVTNGWHYYNDSLNIHGQLDDYASQFRAKRPFMIKMELDMRQAKGEQATLKYIILNDLEQDVKDARTDGKYTNIAFNNIDINKKYRLAVAVDHMTGDKDSAWCELIE